MVSCCDKSNLRYINECTSGSCTVELGLFRETVAISYLVESFLERNIPEESGYEKGLVVVLESIGSCA